jgi:ATP-dependent protease ClpP protease subunit
MKLSNIKNQVKGSLTSFLTSLVSSKDQLLEGEQQSMGMMGMGFPDLYTEEEKKEIHDAELEEFRWETRIKRLERNAPITVFISQEELSAEKTKEEEIIETILSASYFPEREVHIYVNTYGGDVLTMFAIMDAIRSLPNATKTIGIGKIMSAGGPILLSGKIRAMTRNSFLMIHDLSANAYGSPEEINAELEFMEKLKERFISFASTRSSISEDEMRKMMSQKRNHYFGAEEALSLGLIDEIIG